MIRIVAVCAMGFAAGCATAAVEGRFRDQPIVWRVADDRDVAEPTWRFSETPVDRVVAQLDRPARKPAQNTNALDEVPDSTWFSNRIGRRALGLQEVVDGPAIDGPPRGVLTVVEGKIEGQSEGFLVDDERGLRYLIKVDTPANPEQQTANEVIVSRLFWAAGYNVAPNHLVYVRADELQIAPDILFDNPRTGRRELLDRAAVERVLARAAQRERDGAHRVVASQLLTGKRKGGWLPEGVRKDDPNDVVPHQYRRELRGLRIVAAWLGHTDMTRSNTLDMFVVEQGRGFLRHYLVDFGGALGGQQSELGRLEVGWEHKFDLGNQVRATMAFGLWTRTWEKQKRTRWKAIGYFSARFFDPSRWVEFEKYEPFAQMDLADAYWAAKIVMRFDRALLEGVVALGELSERGAAEYLVDTLIARRDAVGRAYLGAVTALDELAVEPDRLCAVDLAVKYGFARDAVIERRTKHGVLVAEYPVGPAGRVCIPLADDDEYRVLRLRARRGDRLAPGMQIHYRGGDRPRILGVIRVD